MKTVRLTTTTGETWKTSINGTREEIRAYFLGNIFNIGTVNDHLVTVATVKFLKP